MNDQYQYPGQQQIPQQYAQVQQSPQQVTASPQYQQQMPPLQQQQPPQQQVGTPVVHLPSAELIEQAHQQAVAAAARGGGDSNRFVKFAPPGGVTSWSAAPVGAETWLNVYILPAFAAGCNIFEKVETHFWKSPQHPKGTAIGCSGADCVICQARDQILSASVGVDPAVIKRAKDYGRVRKQFFYNVALVEDLNFHKQDDGALKAGVLAVGVNLHKDIITLVKHLGGAINVVDPMKGRVLAVCKRKTGPDTMNIEYSVIHQDPSPLPVEFYPLLSGLNDLQAMRNIPDPQESAAAVVDMGLFVQQQTQQQYAQQMPSVGSPQAYSQSQQMQAPPVINTANVAPSGVVYQPQNGVPQQQAPQQQAPQQQAGVQTDPNAVPQLTLEELKRKLQGM